MSTLSRRLVALVVAVAGVAGVGVLEAPRAVAVLEPSGHPITAFDSDGAVQTNFAIVDTFAEARRAGNPECRGAPVRS